MKKFKMQRKELEDFVQYPVFDKVNMAPNRKIK